MRLSSTEDVRADHTGNAVSTTAGRARLIEVVRERSGPVTSAALTRAQWAGLHAFSQMDGGVEMGFRLRWWERALRWAGVAAVSVVVALVIVRVVTGLAGH